MATTEPDYALSDVPDADAPPGPTRALLPLVVVFAGLALATVLLVVLPALHPPKPKTPARPCASFIISESGSARCLDAPLAPTQDPDARPPAAYP